MAVVDVQCAHLVPPDYFSWLGIPGLDTSAAVVMILKVLARSSPLAPTWPPELEQQQERLGLAALSCLDLEPYFPPLPFVQEIQDPLPTLLFLRLPLCCFCDPLCCFCGPLCWNVFPFCWFGDPFCCFWSAKWECVFPKCHPPSRMLILYLSRINNSGPSKAKNQQFLSNKTE